MSINLSLDNVEETSISSSASTIDSIVLPSQIDSEDPKNLNIFKNHIIHEVDALQNTLNSIK